MGVRRARPHDPGPGLGGLLRQSAGLRIEWPHDHPMRGLFYGRAGGGVRVGCAPVCAPGQHVNDAGLGIGRLWFVGFPIARPLQRRRIGAHCNIADHSGMSRETSEAVRAIAQDRHLALRIHVHDLGGFGDLGRRGRESALDLGLFRFRAVSQRGEENNHHHRQFQVAAIHFDPMSDLKTDHRFLDCIKGQAPQLVNTTHIAEA
jgi:hypothetical protein